MVYTDISIHINIIDITFYIYIISINIYLIFIFIIDIILYIYIYIYTYHNRYNRYIQCSWNMFGFYIRRPVGRKSRKSPPSAGAKSGDGLLDGLLGI